MNKIFAVIVTFNSNQLELMEQYSKLKHQVDKIIYVDNASKEFPVLPNTDKNKFKIIYNNCNEGLAKAQNQGIKYALKQGASHILLLDDDSIPEINLVENLIKTESIYKKKGIKIGLIGSRIFDLHKNIFNNSGILFSGIKIKRLNIEDHPESVSYCIASGSLIPSSVLKDVGLMNENLFIDAVDVEWCLRAKWFGYQIIQANNAIIKHKLGNGNKDKILSHSPLREYYIIRNNIFLSRQSYIPYGYRIRKKILILFRILNSLSKFNIKYINKSIKGLIDGFKMK